MTEYRGTRLAVGELPRATQQVAVTLSLALGHRKHNVQNFRAWAAWTMFGVLRGTCLDVNVLELDEDTGKVGAERDRFQRWQTKARACPPMQIFLLIPEMQLDGVLVPIDGANVLREGESGALSVIAAGRPGCFVDRQFEENFGEDARAVGVKPSLSYLVVAIGSNALTERMNQTLQRFSQKSAPILCVNGDENLVSFLRGYDLLETLVDVLYSDGQEPTIGMTFSSPHLRHFTPEIHRQYMTRKLTGSAVSACFAALRNKVAATVCVARKPQVIQIATAARCTRGRIWAIPLREDQAAPPADQHVHVPRRSIVRHEHDFVKDTNVLCVASSISEVCVQDRVRYGNRNRAAVHTLIMSLGSGGVRELHHEFDLERAPFRDFDGNTVVARDFLRVFKEEIRKDEPYAGL